MRKHDDEVEDELKDANDDGDEGATADDYDDDDEDGDDDDRDDDDDATPESPVHVTRCHLAHHSWSPSPLSHRRPAH